MVVGRVVTSSSERAMRPVGTLSLRVAPLSGDRVGISLLQLRHAVGVRWVFMMLCECVPQGEEMKTLWFAYGSLDSRLSEGIISLLSHWVTRRALGWLRRG